MTKKTKNIVSDFANNDMPAEVQEQFRCWLDEHAGGEAAEEQLLEEWNAAKLGPVNGAAYEQSFERLMQSMPAASSARGSEKGPHCPSGCIVAAYGGRCSPSAGWCWDSAPSAPACS